MNPGADLDLETRKSLLSRLRNLDDGESWRTFFDLYWKLLYRVARRSGLADGDAQDVVQETVVAVARQMPEFRYDTSRGSFKSWLFRIVRRRIADHLRRLYRQPSQTEMPPVLAAEDDEQSPLPEAAAGILDASWEEEWEHSILDAAIARVRDQVNPKHFQVFDCCVRLGWPAAKVAATLGMSAAQVYLARHRVSQAVKQAARIIASEHGEWPLPEKPMQDA